MQRPRPQPPSPPPSTSSDGRHDAEDKQQQQQQHHKERKVTAVYVTGLPADVTVEELHSYFSKCGIILEDMKTHKPKIKLYADSTSSVGNCKGDCLVIYYKPESVDLAITLLDESDLRPGVKIRVQKAEFAPKEEHDENHNHPTATSSAEKRSRPTMDKKSRKKFHESMQKKLEWFESKEDGATADSVKENWKKIVVLEHMFSPEEIEADPVLLIDLKHDIEEECSKLGQVLGVKLYERSAEGVVTVKFKEPLSAIACVSLMHGRFFAMRQIEAKLFSAETKERQKQWKLKSKLADDSHVLESEGTRDERVENEEADRLDRFAEWLEGEGDEGNDLK